MFNFSCNQQKRGQGLVEYALILVLVAIVVIATLLVLGPIIGNVFSEINNSLSSIDSGIGAATPIPHGSHVPASGGACPPGSHSYHFHGSSGTYWCIQD